MDKMILGKTGLNVCKSGFGALPIQRLDKHKAVTLLRTAYDSGIDFYDTARYYSDSEEKIGEAFHDVRTNVVIATKTMASTRKDVLASLFTSLEKLKTSYIDLFQLHNPPQLPDHSDANGAYAGLLEAREKGLVYHIGITCHKLQNAIDAAESGLYETVQFPLSILSSDADLKLIDICRDNGVGLIAMKALSGGLITNAAKSFAFLRQFENVLPIWGIQHEWELDEFIAFEKNPPILNDDMWNLIRKDRDELSGLFCRGCGYCMPCPQGIEINWVARMSLLLRRAPWQGFMTHEWQDKMHEIETCTQCGQCHTKCPYGLDTPALLKENLKDYRRFYELHSEK